MRTAADVIKRVQWDPVLDCHRAHVTIGYVDRFKGVLESPFHGFNFADIPQHRIAHFKFRGRIVWEKETRRDDVFGSTGSSVTLADVVLAWEERHPGALEEEAAEVIRCAERDRITRITAPSRRPRGGAHTRRPAAGKANFFVAFRVTDPGILEHVRAVQRHVTAREPRLEVACTPLQSLHVTLCMLELRNGSQIGTARTVMQELQALFQETLGGCEIAFEGLDAFRERVLFAKPQDTSELSKFAARVREAMTAAGLRVADGRKEFRPHCTLIKLDRGLCRTVPQIDREHYTPQINMRFGTQPVHAIYLCSSVSPKRADGFYTTAAATLAYCSEEAEAAEAAACASDVALLLGQVGDPDADPQSAEGDADRGIGSWGVEESFAAEEAARAAAAAAIRDTRENSDKAREEAGLVPLQLAREVSDAARGEALSATGRRDWKEAIADAVVGGQPREFSDHANRLNLIRAASSLAIAFAAAAARTLSQLHDVPPAPPTGRLGAEYPAGEADAFFTLVRVLAWIRCATTAALDADHERQCKGVLAVLRGVRGSGKTRLAHALLRASLVVDAVFATASASVLDRARTSMRAVVVAMLAGSDQETDTARGARLASLMVAPAHALDTAPLEELLDTGNAREHAARITPEGGVFSPLSAAERGASDQGPPQRSSTCVVAHPLDLITNDPDCGRRVPAKRRQQAASLLKETVANALAANAALVIIDDTHASPADFAWPWRLAEVTGHGRAVLSVACVTRALAVVMGRRASPPLSEDAAIRGWATWVPHKGSETLLSPALSHEAIVSVARLERETLRAVRQLRRRATQPVGDFASAGPSPSFGLTALGGDASTLESESEAAGAAASGAAPLPPSSAKQIVELATELDNVRHPAIVFTGLFLTPESRRALLESVGVEYDEVYADHLTVAFAPTVACVRCHPVGARIPLRVIGMATATGDVRAQCVSAELDIPAHASPTVQLMPFLVSSHHPHITVSVPTDQSASNSIRVLRAGAVIPLDQDPPLRLEAVAGIAVKDIAQPGSRRRVLLDSDSFQAWADEQAPNLPLTQAPDAITITAALRACGTDPEDAGVVDMIEGIKSPTPKADPALSRPLRTPHAPEAAAAIRCIRVFDWDGTLCRSLGPAEGVRRWEVAHGTPWPHDDYLGHSESLMGPLAPEAGPALAAFRKAVARPDTLTIVITGRAASSARGVHCAARHMKIRPHGWFFKPVTTHPTAPFKQRTLQRVLQAFPSVCRVEAWEDEEESLQAYQVVGRADQRLTVIAHHVVATDPLPAAQGAVHEALLAAAPHNVQLSPFLVRRGAIRLRAADDAARKALAWVVSNLASLAVELCPSLADTGLLQKPDAIVLPHGSWPLGRTFNDVDAVVIAPDVIGANDLVATAAQALRNAGLLCVHEAAPARCPSVRCRVPTSSGRVIDVDIAFARAPGNLVAQCVALGAGGSDHDRRSEVIAALQRSADASQDTATRAALQGPALLLRIQHSLNDTGVDATHFAVAADAILAAIEPFGWRNAALHAPRPFQWVQWMVEACNDVMRADPHAIRDPHSLAMGLLRVMAAVGERTIAARFAPAVPRAYAKAIRTTLGQLAAASEGTDQFMPAPTLAGVCTRHATTLGATHRPVAITITGSQATAQWRAQLLVAAKIGTAVRSMTREGMDVVPLPRIQHATRACVRHLGFAATLPDPLGQLSEWTRESPAGDGDHDRMASMQSPAVDVIAFAIPQGPHAKAAAKQCLAPTWRELSLALGKSAGCRVDVHFPPAAMLSDLLA